MFRRFFYDKITIIRGTFYYAMFNNQNGYIQEVESCQ